MKNNFMMAIVGGIVATVVMTLIMMMGPSMGMPKMEPPQMLAGMTGTSVAIGWVMHFMIGIIFALLYAYLILGWLSGIGSNLAKGVVFGFIAFVIAQVSLFLIGQMTGGMAEPEGGMVLMMIGSLVGHIIFGVVVAQFVKR